MGVVTMELKLVTGLVIVLLCMTTTAFAFECYACSGATASCNKEPYSKPSEHKTTCAQGVTTCVKRIATITAGGVTSTQVYRGCYEGTGAECVEVADGGSIPFPGMSGSVRGAQKCCKTSLCN